MPPPSPGPILTLRAAVVLLIALVVGIASGVVGFLAHYDAATAVLIGGGAAASALAMTHRLVGS
jgi:hypothetical protein